MELSGIVAWSRPNRSPRPLDARLTEAIPRDIFSRSPGVSARRERRRAAGGIPPRGNHKHRMELGGLSKARPISCSDCPAFHRLQMSLFSIAESPNRFPGLIQHHLSTADLYQMVLHRPVETTRITGHLKLYFTCPVSALIRKSASRTSPVSFPNSCMDSFRVSDNPELRPRSSRNQTQSRHPRRNHPHS